MVPQLRAPLLGTLVCLAIGEGLGFDLSTCQQHAVWLTYPVPRDTLLEWMRAQVQAKDQDELQLETPAEYGTKHPGSHPMQIEFDTNLHCSSFGFVPYPNFQEIVIQIPYVRFRGQVVRYQPWALVDNIGGKAAMTLLGARSQMANPFSVSFGPVPANWTQLAKVAAEARFEVAGVEVGGFEKSADLQEHDETWRDLISSKMSTFIGYDWCIPEFQYKYGCSRIAYNLTETRATRVVTGKLDVSAGDGSEKFAPFDIHRTLSGLEAYAVQTTFTVQLGGCSTDHQQHSTMFSTTIV